MISLGYLKAPPHFIRKDKYKITAGITLSHTQTDCGKSAAE